jgi:hypothetical protein
VKGIELPINILVIVAIAVIVLLGMVALYFAGWSPFSGSLSYEAVKNTACAELVRTGCGDTTQIITTGFDVDGSGTAGDSGDTLQLLCETYYGVTSGDQVACRTVCGCPISG